jgi:beta-glucosidase
MRKRIVFLLAVIIYSYSALCQVDTLLYKNKDADIEDRIDDLISRMTLEEKVMLLAGDTTSYDTKPNERLGIPVLRMADGPVGIRSEKATAFPASVCMAATWNTDLIYSLGQALGREAKAKGKNVLLAPCVNIHRVPHGGRNFESFGEDPFLSGRIAVNYIRGVQSEKVIATVKHFTCNNQEHERNSIDVRIDERTLHEIYLPAYKAAVTEGGVWSVMSAYNRLNGQHCSSNTWLLTDILKKKWDFKGFVVSDWGAVHSSIPALYAGTDLEMPNDKYFTVENVEQALRWRLLKTLKIDDKVRRIFRAMFNMDYFDKTESDTGACNTPEHRAIARQIAQEGIVLLKNDNSILPVQHDVQSIAVIGRNASKLMYGGGGSSHVTPFNTVSPLEALKSKAGEDYILKYESGIFDEKDFIPIPSESLIPPDDYSEKHGLLGAYYENPVIEGEPLRKQIDSIVDFTWGRGGPEGIRPDFFSVTWEGQLVASESGSYALSIGSDNGSRLYINDEMVINNWDFMRNEAIYEFTTVELEKDKPVNIKIEYSEFWGNATIRLMWNKIKEHPLQKAVHLAESSDMVVLFMGYSMNDESEGKDRKMLALPHNQEEIISAVAEINPNTVVILNCGAGILIFCWVMLIPQVSL